MVKVEVRFRDSGFCDVYFDGDDVVIDNGVYRYRKKFGGKKDIYALFIAIGHFVGTFRDEVIDYEVVK